MKLFIYPSVPWRWKQWVLRNVNIDESTRCHVPIEGSFYSQRHKNVTWHSNMMLEVAGYTETSQNIRRHISDACSDQRTCLRVGYWANSWSYREWVMGELHVRILRSSTNVATWRRIIWEGYSARMGEMRDAKFQFRGCGTFIEINFGISK